MIIGYYICDDMDTPSWGSSYWYPNNIGNKLNAVCYHPSETVWIVPNTEDTEMEEAETGC